MTRTAPAPTSTRQDLETIDAHWRAANYLSVGQIYLLDNPLLREPLRIGEDVDVTMPSSACRAVASTERSGT